MQEPTSPAVDVEFPEEEALPVADELTVLKARADQLGIQYHPSIGLEKLKAKVQDTLNGEVESVEKKVPEAKVKEEETEGARRGRKRKEANALVRIRVACMNPQKKEWEGEIITTGNAVVGTIRKYVAFNTEDGYHVPRMIYTQLINRMCQVFYTNKDNRGNKSRKGKLIKEFSVELLTPLTPKELKDLAQRQAMATSGSDA